MSDSDHPPPSSEALERTLNELLAAETVLDGRNGRHFQSVVEQVVSGLTTEQQLAVKLQAETRMGFGMALGKFLAWRAWTEIEKSDKRRTSSKTGLDSFTLRVPAMHLEEVKRAWTGIKVKFQERVGFALVEPTLEPSEEGWTLERRGGLLEARELPEDWEQPLLQLLVDQAPNMLTLSMVKELIEQVKRDEPAIADEIERFRLPVTTPYRVLRSLLEESVPIHEVETILTALILQMENGQDRQQLLSSARLALSPWICKKIQYRPGVVKVLRVGQKIEDAMLESIRYSGSEYFFSLEPRRKAEITFLLKQALLRSGGPECVALLTDPRIRQEVSSMLRAELPGTVVLTSCEVHRGFKLETVAVVDLTQTENEAGDNSEGTPEVLDL